ncbi:hypothetical protein LY76DRAFT_347631 [Colletotrichum caudatum]|nr:hypothetical protein LY76DRAFT_347631 [Colletotrichum caudatum]
MRIENVVFGLSCCCSTPGGRGKYVPSPISLSLMGLSIFGCGFFMHRPPCAGRARFFYGRPCNIRVERGVKRGNGFMILSNMKCIKKTRTPAVPQSLDVHDDCMCGGDPNRKRPDSSASFIASESPPSTFYVCNSGELSSINPYTMVFMHQPVW